MTSHSQRTIVKGKPSDLEELFNIYLAAKDKLEQQGLNQWTSNYPTPAIIESDLKKGIMYLLKKDNAIIGAVNISEEQEKEYQTINWKCNDTKVLVIHRLVVAPQFQGQGYAISLMDFAEDFALKHNYTSIRLDAYSANKRVIKFYQQRNYVIRGNVYFPEREHPFYCMEKEMGMENKSITKMP